MLLQKVETTVIHACFQEVSGLIKMMKISEASFQVITANIQTLFSLLFGKPTQKTMDQWEPVLVLHFTEIFLTNNSGEVSMTALV